MLTKLTRHFVRAGSIGMGLAIWLLIPAVSIAGGLFYIDSATGGLRQYDATGYA
jgi:hypothetical protein